MTAVRNKYIRLVSRNIKVSKRRKREIISDLEELFELAERNGESEEQVIERLGEPEMFAMNCVESLLEETEQSNRNKRGVILSMVLSMYVTIINGSIFIFEISGISNRCNWWSRRCHKYLFTQCKWAFERKKSIYIGNHFARNIYIFTR